MHLEKKKDQIFFEQHPRVKCSLCQSPYPQPHHKQHHLFIFENLVHWSILTFPLSVLIYSIYSSYLATLIATSICHSYIPRGVSHWVQSPVIDIPSPSDRQVQFKWCRKQTELNPLRWILDIGPLKAIRFVNRPIWPRYYGSFKWVISNSKCYYVYTVQYKYKTHNIISIYKVTM